MKSTSAEAWAKFIVSGEHAVLSGAPCLVYPLKQARLRIKAHPGAKAFGASLNGSPLSSDRLEKLSSAAHLAGWNPDRLKDTQIDIESAIPLGSGLGSSAALCVCLARLSDANLSEEAIFQAALRAESVFHGRSSGADPAGVCSHHPILYTMADQNRERFRAAKGAPFVWGLRDSGARRESANVISSIDNAAPQEDLKARLIQFAAMIPELLRQGDWDQVPAAIESLGEVHRQLGLVNESLDKSFAQMKSEGALACKLTGAGRGGFALGLYPLAAVPMLKKSDVFVAPLDGNDEDAF